EETAARIEAELGRVDVVVNNAGFARGDDRVPATELDPGAWRSILDVNLNGTFYMSRVFGGRMVADERGGSIVNISSIAGKVLPPATAAYAASKAGIQALTVSMAKDVGPSGVRVNA